MCVTVKFYIAEKEHLHNFSNRRGDLIIVKHLSHQHTLFDFSFSRMRAQIITNISTMSSIFVYCFYIWQSWIASVINNLENLPPSPTKRGSSWWINLPKLWALQGPSYSTPTHVNHLCQRQDLFHVKSNWR